MCAELVHAAVLSGRPARPELRPAYLQVAEPQPRGSLVCCVLLMRRLGPRMNRTTATQVSEPAGKTLGAQPVTLSQPTHSPPATPHSRKALPSVLQPSSLHGHSSADFYEQRTGSLLGQQWETRGPCSSPRAPRPGGEEPFVRGHRPLQRRAVRDRSSQGPLRSRDSGPGSTWQDSLEEENTGVIQVTEVKDSDKGERSRRRADSEAPVTGTCSPRLRN